MDHNYEVYYAELRALYEDYLELVPDDLEGYYGLALSYTDHHEYKAVLDMALVVIQKKGIDARWAALMAQAYAARGEPDKAIALFERYLEIVDKKERAFYDDIRLIARPEEIFKYEALTEEARSEFLDAFWRRRDPLLVSEGQARRAEHYRRVWYARTYFGKTAYPWDQRGEMYIRYGEPDYRVRSGFPNRLPPIGIESIKTKVHADIGFIPPFMASGAATPQAFFDKQVGSGGNMKGLEYDEMMPIYPVLLDPSMGHKDVPWEAWYYLEIGGGIELTFRDDAMNGNFQYPPVPDDLRVIAYHPEVLMEAITRQTPDKYEIPPGVETLEFYYDVVQFKGVSGETVVEVYLGIPPLQVRIENGEGNVAHALAITHLNGDVVARSDETVRFAVQDTSALQTGTFIPQLVSLTVDPGTYRLALQLTDKNSGKWGVYAQELDVVAFADSLAMSDLEMAFEIATYPKDQQFKKGDVWVIPMPSRHYQRSQSTSVYYEVYHLTQNEFGQTHYRVDYTIQQDVRKGGSLLGSLGAGFKRALTSGKPQVVVGYEREGRATWEPIYLELDTEQVKAGLNQLMVTVTDLVSGQSVSKEALFQLSE